ncbi:thymidine phosphorylase [Patescibacteria group bacterium]|nr:thymidine phosphorylase [Patescibacteria group bacterium]MBU1890636.1 thymidine phosphorylase [Patescibacteria group bacterium]
MPYFLKSKKLDFKADGPYVAVLSEPEAKRLGVQNNDDIEIRWGKHRVIAEADFTNSKVKKGEIGLFHEIWEDYPLKKGEVVQIKVLSRPASIKAIIKKLLGKRLNYEEIYSIIKDIVSRRLGRSEISYFVASSFARHYNDTELYYLTKAMAETGEQLRFKGKVVDKHSVGGLAGNRTSMMVVPIVASTGLVIPKTSSRAVTSPAGTADTMEVICPVQHSVKSIKKFIKKNNCCLVWGGGLNIAPSDDRIIRASHPLGIEPYNKMIVSIMAKKVAMGIKYLIIDMPVGPTTKIPNIKLAWDVERKFVYLGKRFGMKVKVKMTDAREPVGRGVGPALEARDALRVLQQHPLRPLDLEKKSIILAGELFELCGKVKKGRGRIRARQILESGEAWKMMQKIIKAQGGNPDIKADDVTLGAIKKRYFIKKNATIKEVLDTSVDDIARLLGAPDEKLAGIHIHQRIGSKVKKGDPSFTFYAQSKERMRLAEVALKKMKIFLFKKK